MPRGGFAYVYMVEVGLLLHHADALQKNLGLAVTFNEWVPENRSNICVCPVYAKSKTQLISKGALSTSLGLTWRESTK